MSASVAPASASFPGARAARRRRIAVVVAGVAIVGSSAVAALLIGPVRLDTAGVLRELFGWVPFVGGSSLDEREATILWQLRAPRVALACVVRPPLVVVKIDTTEPAKGAQ